MVAHPFSRRRRRIIQAVGATALLSSAIVSVFFVLIALSASSQHVLLTISIVSAVLNICACVPILLFTALLSSPSSSRSKRGYRLCGAVSAATAGLASAATLGWLAVRRNDLPPTILGRSSLHLVLVGFGVYLATIVLQSVFFTAINLPSPTTTTTTTTTDSGDELGHWWRRRRQGWSGQSNSEAATVAYPSPAASASKLSLSSTIRDPKHPFVAQLYHHLPHNSKTLRNGGGGSPTSALFSSTSLTPHHRHHPHEANRQTAVAVVEVNHFDDWETSDVSVTERVAASLAAAEQEAMEEERQQRQQAGGDGGGDGGGSITSTTSATAPASSSKSRQMAAYDAILLPASSVCESEGSGEGGGGSGGGGTGGGPERRSSPPLPENDVSPRSCAFMLPVNAVLASSVPRFTMRSGGGGGRGGRGVGAGGAVAGGGGGGTGKWSASGDRG